MKYAFNLKKILQPKAYFSGPSKLLVKIPRQLLGLIVLGNRGEIL